MLNASPNHEASPANVQEPNVNSTISSPVNLASNIMSQSSFIDQAGQFLAYPFIPLFNVNHQGPMLNPMTRAALMYAMTSNFVNQDDNEDVYVRGPADPNYMGRPLKHPGIGQPEILCLVKHLPVISDGKPPILFQTEYNGERKYQLNLYTGNIDVVSSKPIELDINVQLKKEDELQFFLTMADPTMPPGQAPSTCKDWNHDAHRNLCHFLTIVPRHHQYNTWTRDLNDIPTEIVKVTRASATVQIMFNCTSEQSLPLTNGYYWLHARLTRKEKVLLHVVFPITSHPSLRNDANERFGSPGWIPMEAYDGSPLRREPTPKQVALKRLLTFTSWYGSQQQAEQIDTMTNAFYSWALLGEIPRPT